MKPVKVNTVLWTYGDIQKVNSWLSSDPLKWGIRELHELGIESPGRVYSWQDVVSRVRTAFGQEITESRIRQHNGPFSSWLRDDCGRQKVKLGGGMGSVYPWPVALSKLPGGQHYEMSPQIAAMFRAARKEGLLGDVESDSTWGRDELILVLHFYFDRGLLGDSSRDVIELSELIRSLRGQLGFGGPHHSPADVALKLEHFAALDRAHSDGDPRQGTPQDAETWRRFCGRREELSALARQLRELVSLPGSLPDHREEGEEGVPEGAIAYRLHRVRERNAQLTARKKRAMREQLDRLACEVCDFDFEQTYGDIGYDFMECHHRIPLAQTNETQSHLSDLALLCSNCHRMMHRTDAPPTVDGLRRLIGIGNR